jgi:hypothetical protein
MRFRNLRDIPTIITATVPYKAAFRIGVVSQLAEVSGSIQEGHVMYTRFQYMSVHHEFGALKKMKLSTPQKIGTPRPTTAQINPCLRIDIGASK